MGTDISDAELFVIADSSVAHIPQVETIAPQCPPLK
jgi:hypothetical protein